MSIVLPYRARRAYRRAFGFVLGGLVTALVGSGLWWLAVPWWPAWTGAAALFFVGLAVADGGALELVYKAWNKGGRELARLTRAVTLRLAYYLVVTLAPPGRQGGGLDGWQPYGGRSASAGDSLVRPLRSRGWRDRYSEWTRWRRRGWAMALLPFLWVLSYLGDEMERPEFSHDIYTLY